METIFSTRDLPAAERFDGWHEIVCRQLAATVESEPKRGSDFHADMRYGRLLDLGVVDCTISPIFVTRNASHVARDGNDHFLLAVVRRGMRAIEQHGNAAIMNRGDMVLIDLHAPYRCEISTTDLATVQMFTIPRRTLESRIGVTRDMFSRLISPNTADGHLAASYLTSLPARLTGDHSPMMEALLREHALDLIAVILSTSAGQYNALTTAARFVRLQLRAVINARLEDPTLDRQRIAAAAGISVRRANEILAKEGTSLTQLLLQTRLSRSRQLLSDPVQRYRQITDIAFACGFSDLAHFGRAFKKTFGCAPSECRETRCC